MTASAQYENMGDELINVILMREAALRGRLTVFRGNAPQWYIDNLISGVKKSGANISVLSSPWAFLTRIFTSWLCLRRPTILLSPGDATSHRENWQRDVALAILLAIGVKLLYIGISAFNLPKSRLFLLRRMTRKAPSIAVRDKFTLDYLRGAGVKASLIPDLAFRLEHPQVTAPMSNVALLSFRVPAKGADLLERKISHLIALLRANGLRPILFSQVERDQGFNRGIAERFGLDFDERSMARSGRWNIYEDMYRSAIVVVSNRLHVLLFGLFNGCGALALVPYRERKITGVFDMIGLQNCIATTADEVEAGLLRAIARETQMHESLLAVSTTFPELLDAVFQNQETFIDKSDQGQSGALECRV